MKKGLILLLAACSLTTVRAQDVPDQQTVYQVETAGSVNKRAALSYLAAINTVEGGAVAHYTAGEAVALKPGFRAQAGSVFLARIGTVPANYPSAEGSNRLNIRASPNPFQQSTQIEYVLLQASQISFTLVDEQGHILRQEASLAGQEAGRQVVGLTGANLPAGVYFFQMRINGKQQTVRLLKIK